MQHYTGFAAPKHVLQLKNWFCVKTLFFITVIVNSHNPPWVPGRTSQRNRLKKSPTIYLLINSLNFLQMYSKMHLLPPTKNSVGFSQSRLGHSGLTGKLSKCVQYGINDLYRPGFVYQIFLVLVVLYTNLFKLSRTAQTAKIKRLKKVCT